MVVVEASSIHQNSVRPLFLYRQRLLSRGIELGVIRIKIQLVYMEAAHIIARVFPFVVPGTGSFACIRPHDCSRLCYQVSCASPVNRDTIFRLDAEQWQD